MCAFPYVFLKMSYERRTGLRRQSEEEEFRWKIVKAMLDEYPFLREKVRVYINR